MTDIDHLLSLDLTDPAAALEFNEGIARLAGWDKDVAVGGGWVNRHTLQWRISPPFYRGSVDAALTLPLRLADYRLSRVGNGYNFTIYDSPTNEKCVGYGDTAALAICFAWLRYRRAQSAPVATAKEEA